MGFRLAEACDGNGGDCTLTARRVATVAQSKQSRPSLKTQHRLQRSSESRGLFAEAESARAPGEDDFAALRGELWGWDFNEGAGVEFREREAGKDGRVVTGAQRTECLRETFTFERKTEANFRARGDLAEMGGELAGAGLRGDWEFGNRAEEIGVALPGTKQHSWD